MVMIEDIEEEVMKLGMTFEGGANRTVFSCGVADAFLEEGLMPDYFIGVSAGIAFGVSYLAGQKGRNWELMEKYVGDKRYMGMRHLFNKEKKTYYNVEFVFEELPNNLLPFDYEGMSAYLGEVYACVTNIHTGKAEYLKVPRDHTMRDYLVASCSLPVLFQPVKIGRHYYLDGALADSIPYEQAIRAGCDKNILVLTRSRDYIKSTGYTVSVASKLYRNYPHVVEDLKTRAERYNKCMEEIHRREQDGELFVIAPEDTFGIGRIESNTEKLRKLYQEGYDQTMALMPQLREYLSN